MTTLDTIKNQIHAESSGTTFLMWVIIAKVYQPEGFWAFIIAIFIIGNCYTMLKSAFKLPKGYFN